MNVGSVLRKSRKRAGYSQEGLALDMHTSLSAISKMENNKQRVDIEMFVNWMRHTNAQDLMIASLLAVDPSAAQQIVEMISQTVPLMIGVVA